MQSLTTLFLILSLPVVIFSQVSTQECPSLQQKYFQIGIGLGELPAGGSFKPSITFGYHFSSKFYAGFIYQFKDHISRDDASFNAQSAELDGLLSSTEDVAQRWMAHIRYTPFRNGPYLSGGLVFNGRDTEHMRFDARDRSIGGESYTGTVHIDQTRPAGWGLALGLGYQYNLRNGLSAGMEWTPAWGQYPEPSYAFSGSADLSEEARAVLGTKMDKGFRSSVTNMYKVFHVGLAYRFE